jgi:hypothetical protein
LSAFARLAKWLNPGRWIVKNTRPILLKESASSERFILVTKDSDLTLGKLGQELLLVKVGEVAGTPIYRLVEKP